jgi:hypothetical protein
MSNGYRSGGQVTRNGRTHYRRGTNIKAPRGVMVAAGIGVGAAALFGSGSALTIGVAVVGVGAVIGWRYRRQIRPVTRKVQRWTSKRLSKRKTRPTFDIFDSRDGETLKTVRGERAAKRASRKPGMDYCPEGEGW